MSTTTIATRTTIHRKPGWLARLLDYKPFLIVACLSPAIGLLLPKSYTRASSARRGAGQPASSSIPPELDPPPVDPPELLPPLELEPPLPLEAAELEPPPEPVLPRASPLELPAWQPAQPWTSVVLEGWTQPARPPSRRNDRRPSRCFMFRVSQPSLAKSTSHAIGLPPTC